MFVVGDELYAEVESSGSDKSLEGRERRLLTPCLDARDLGLRLSGAARKLALGEAGASTSLTDDRPSSHKKTIA